MRVHRLGGQTQPIPQTARGKTADVLPCEMLPSKKFFRLHNNMSADIQLERKQIVLHIKPFAEENQEGKGPL